MADETYEPTAGSGRGRGGASGSGSSNDTDWGCLLVMDDVVDKLKLLNYESGFCAARRFPLLHRLQFVMQEGAAGTQFHYFVSLVSWLLSLNGQKYTAPQQFDDPNASTSTLMHELKKAGVKVDAAPSKVKLGYGDAVCMILNELCNMTLRKRHVTLQAPAVEPGNTGDADGEDEIEVDESAEIGADENFASNEVGDEEETMYMDGLQHSGSDDSLIEDAANDVLVASVDPAAWKLELERVRPRLKAVNRVTDNKEWRAHFDSMKMHAEEIRKALDLTKKQLETIAGEIDRSLQKLATREKHINAQMPELVDTYRAEKAKLEQVTEQYNGSNGTVTKLTNDLANILEELEHVKQQIDTSGSSFGDTSPLVKIKSALASLRKETAQMDIRIGTVEQILMTARVKAYHNQDKSRQQNFFHVV